MTLYDLHAHSNISDGILSPEMLVSRAKERGVDVLALTDHDTVAGLVRARNAAVKQGLRLIDGIEFSSNWGKIGVHVVGLAVDPTSPGMQQAVVEQCQVRERRAEKIAERLTKLGLPGTLAGAKALAGDAVLGRPHFAQFLVDMGAVKSLNQAFKKYLGAGKPGDVKHMWPAMDTVIDWIRTAGGVAVLAHPHKYNLTRTKICALASDFAAAGGRAIEVVSGRQDPGVAEDLARIANERGLYASCGSDFHVPDQPWQELGAFGTMPALCKPVWELF